ncbi:midcut-by-XrtH protein [Comamonas sp. JUb58]|uniref:midcut-by-XrtH protein n=1 Tax=Comamonas sp. JUb58 TaxID=2485114 RepID=UPI0010620178|nr:midcut-by-XrtH protein [Comamonas sp. JUb58]TDS82200.1 hypothetical protein EDF71_108116 [Comamonas sp. JUb58]
MTFFSSTMRYKPLACLGGLAALLSSGMAQAQLAACQVDVNYLPVVLNTPSAVPGLTGMGVMGLSLALAGGLAWRMRKAAAGQHLSALLGAALVVGACSGAWLTSQAVAAAASLSNPAGGSLSLSDTSNTLTNNTSGPLTLGLTLTQGSLAEGSTCTAGQTLAVGASCAIVLSGCSGGGSGGNGNGGNSGGGNGGGI